MATDAAELARIFGYEPEEDEVEDEPTDDTVDESETESTEGDEPEGEKGGEGKDEPRDVAASEQSTEEEAPTEPKAEISDEKPSDDRYKRLLGELKRYRKYSPIVEMFEEEPELARRVLAQRMGLGEEKAPAEEAPAKTATPTPEQVESIKKYWERRMQEDPVGALAEFFGRMMDERLEGTKQIGVKSVIRDFKADRKAADPLFTQYEDIFDTLVKKANTQVLQDDPDSSLQGLEVLAFGIWAKKQREAMARAKTREKPSVKEKPRSLSTSTSAGPAKGSAKPKRALTEEERYLANLYGEENLDTEEEEKSVWGRG